MNTYYCPKCQSEVRITSTLYAMETRYMPAEYIERAECPACGWEGSADDVLDEKDVQNDE